LRRLKDTPGQHQADERGGRAVASHTSQETAVTTNHPRHGVKGPSTPSDASLPGGPAHRLSRGSSGTSGGSGMLDLPDRLALLGLEHVFGPAGCPVARQG
jgi:hypothetical protein